MYNARFIMKNAIRVYQYGLVAAMPISFIGGCNVLHFIYKTSIKDEFYNANVNHKLKLLFSTGIITFGVFTTSTLIGLTYPISFPLLYRILS
jgi:hypothetical protein